jgi:hypothetical protein
MERLSTDHGHGTVDSTQCWISKVWQSGEVPGRLSGLAFSERHFQLGLTRRVHAPIIHRNHRTTFIISPKPLRLGHKQATISAILAHLTTSCLQSKPSLRASPEAMMLVGPVPCRCLLSFICMYVVRILYAEHCTKTNLVHLGGMYIPQFCRLQPSS